MKATKTSLRRIVDWSSSRYNVVKKDRVVSDMLKIIQAGHGTAEYTTGSYSERGHQGGWSWHVDGAARSITRQPGVNGERESVYSFE